MECPLCYKVFTRFAAVLTMKVSGVKRRFLWSVLIICPAKDLNKGERFRFAGLKT